MNHKKPVILCVDDEKIILDSLQEQILNRLGERFECEVAQSGEEGLEVIDELRTDGREIAVIISDQLMPSMKGDQFLITAHKKIPDSYKILLTGQATLDAVQNAINNARLYRYVMKPWREDDLMLTVEEAAEAYLQRIRLQFYMRLLRDINTLTQKLSGEREINRLIEKYFESLVDTVGFASAKIVVEYPQQDIYLEGIANVLNAYAKKVQVEILQREADKERYTAIRQEIEDLIMQAMLEDSRHILVAPIRLQQGGRDLGHVVIERSEGVDYLREQREVQNTLQTLTSQLAISLENAALYHTILEQKKELEDSIRYAKRIQLALIPSPELIQYHLPESFIFYLPKAVVSGDFYWFAEQQNGRYIYLAVVDCTGHGVPGAFMSVLVSNALSYAVNEMGITDVAGVLQIVDLQVREKLQRQAQGEVVQDGAEMCLVQIDRERGELHVAGARRPLIYYRDGQRHELHPTPRSIADDPNLFKDTPFTSHKVLPQPGDMFFFFSDGYADQEGTIKRRMGKSRFYELLDEIHALPAAQQRQILEQRFREWKGDLEQTDDVLVMGFRYTPLSSSLNL
ncbi:MAG: SpoIIE family protein phosphatase [Bacteroidia bacterium]|nr:SpoIIE family protein phosphatase [Bacteroidia bacterium]MCX7652982.1 SpoIIE family protein phosphatase [Bacteroidia bacterium]MDW8417455.1 SpoIIE family protein phosphatase [Bacteroidia bacterium]